MTINRKGNDDASWWVAILSGMALACSACSPANKEVGSACKNGVCPEALASDAPVCLASSLQVLVAFDPDQPDQEEVICLPRRLATDAAGRVQCNMLWEENGAPLHCSDLPFLAPGEDGRRCVVPQVDPHAADASTEEGWYYDGEGPAAPCVDLGYDDSAAAIRFTAGARPPSGVAVLLSCASVQEIDADGEVIMSNGAMCRLPPNSARHENTVGDSCTPRVVPEDGFAESQAYLQTGAAECGTGACLVYHLEGDPTPGCEDVDAGDVKRCADPAQAEDRVYCSCRCAGPGVDSSELCDCPDGFSCQEDLFRDAPEALRGGYCMRIPK